MTMTGSREGKSRLARLLIAVIIAIVAIGSTVAMANRSPVGLTSALTNPSAIGLDSVTAARQHRPAGLEGRKRVRTRRARNHAGPTAYPAPAPAAPPAPGVVVAPAPVTPPASGPVPDTEAPETTISGGPEGSTVSTLAVLTFASSEPGSSFTCKLNSGPWTACASPQSYPGLGVGTHQFSVRATDAAGNTDATAATWAWTVNAIEAGGDVTAPQTTITGGPLVSTTDTAATFTFASSEAGSNFACRLDSGGWSICASPKSYSGLAVGSHRFWVRAGDAAGNVDSSAAIYEWTVTAPPPVDTTPPNTSITSQPPAATTSTAASFDFSSDESESTFECKLDGGPWTACSPPYAYTVGVGEHEFLVRATDAALNVDDSPASAGWTVETPSPPPPPPASDCTTTVTSTATAQSAVNSAATGAVVCLAGGSYGKLTLNTSKAVPGVTIRAASPGATTIAGASIQGANLTLAGFISTGSIQVQPGASGITIEHNRVTGGGQGIDVGPTSTTTINDTKIIGNQLIGPFGEDAIHLNRYHDGDGDGVGILIEGNEITNVRENGNHSDCLQTVWVGDHIVFRKNYLHDNRCQGFFVKDQASLGGVSGPIAGITVENNLFVRNKQPCAPEAPGCGQPTYFQVFGPYSGFTMRRNTIWGDGADSIAAFREGTGSDTQIASNVIYRLWTDTNMSAAALTDNTVCKRETGAGGTWTSSRPGETTACNLSFQNAASDDYRLSGDRGVDWAPAQQHFGP